MKINSSILNFSAQILIASGAFMLHALPASAIVNVEQAIIGKPTEGVHVSLGLFADGANGNTDKSSSKADLLTLWQHGDDTEFLQLQYAYGKSSGQVDTDRAFAHLRHRTGISATWGVEGFAQTGRNPFARLTRRTLLGGGMRWVMFEEERNLPVISASVRSMKMRFSLTNWAPTTRRKPICGGPIPIWC